MNIFLKILIGGLVFFGALDWCAAQTKIVELSYEVTPFIETDSPYIQIRTSFEGNAAGKTKIRLPLEFGGQQSLYRGIDNLRVTGANVRLRDTESPEIKIVEHAPNASVQLAYNLIQDWKGAPTAGGASTYDGGGYRPILQKDYFHFLGSGAWILPNLPKNSPLKVSIKWKNVPPDLTLANSFGANQKEQKFSTTVDSFESSIFVGGDYQINRRTVRGKPIFTATRGKWNFTNEEFATLVEKIVGIQREFWNDFDHPYFLVTLLPIESDPKSKSIGGSGLTDSFATFVTTNASLDDVAPLIAHEYFHNWNTIAFGGMKAPEQAVYWFSEGFTDYYTYRLLRRGKMIDSEKYLSFYNEFLSDYYRSAVRNADNQRIVRDFFKDSAVSKLPYRRGMFLATKWNEIILRQSNGAKSLDDVMRQILRESREKPRKISTEYVVSVLSQHASYDFAADVKKYVENGETIGDFKNVFGNCVEYSEVNSGKFEIGFDFDAARKSKIIPDVLVNSAAEAAGVRQGQKIAGLSVYFGNIDKPVELEIEENGLKRMIKYLPEATEKISIPQFKLKENLPENEKAQCLSK